jgi:hypothetical protein
MLGDELLLQLDELGTKPEWFMQDDAPPQYALCACHWLDENFTNTCIGQTGTMEWALRSPNLNPTDFAM